MVEIQLEQFGNTLKRFRDLKRLSQRQLADLLEISQSQISLLESEKMYPNIHTLKSFAKLKGKELVIMLRGTRKD